VHGVGTGRLRRHRLRAGTATLPCGASRLVMPVAALRSWNLRDKFVSQRIPEEIVQEVLLRADVADVVGEHVLLRKTGENYKGLCPFHDEKTPSFTVSPGKGFFYCFGCQAKGNAAGFLMQHASVSFPEAIQMLASRYGVSIPKTGDTHISDRHKPLYDLLRSAATFFRDTLRRDATGEPGRTFCRQRGISGDLADRFELGFAPPAWSALRQAMVRQGFPEELLVQGGLLIERREPQHRLYDRFRGRIVFPIHDRTGRPVAFGARALAESGDHDGPKYLNSPETPIFHKAQTLYGLHLSRHAMRQSQQAIIVEGYTDVLACHRHGVANVVGTLGTALTDRHVAQLRTVVKEAVLVLMAMTRAARPRNAASVCSWKEASGHASQPLLPRKTLTASCAHIQAKSFWDASGTLRPFPPI